MATPYLTYRLIQGYIPSWLALGPCDSPVEERPQADESELDFRARVLRSRDHTALDVSPAPVELDTITCGGETLFWEIDNCRADHMLDRSVFTPRYTYRRVWATASLSCPGARTADLHLTTTCSAGVWLNGKQVAYFEYLTPPEEQTPKTHSFSISLASGRNRLIVRLEDVAIRDAAMAMSLSVAGLPLDKARAFVSTVTEEPDRRQAWEQAFSATHMERSVFTRDDRICLVCDDDMPSFREGIMRLQMPDGRIYAESHCTFRKGERIEAVWGVQVPNGAFNAVLMPPPGNYYELKFRARRHVPFWSNNFTYAESPEAAWDQRLIEAFQEAYRSDDVLYAEIAKMALGWWELVEAPAIEKVIARVSSGAADALPDLLGLIGMRLRMAHFEKFPAGLVEKIDACISGFDYAERSNTAFDLTLESNQILLYACQILAGQLFDKQKLQVSGLTGRQMRLHADKATEAWLKQHAQTGFAQWGAHTDRLVTALTHLTDLAKKESVQEFSAVLLDKTFYDLAVHSFRGIYGGSRRHALPAWLRSGRFAPETALNRLAWGVGAYNSAYKGAVSLVLAGKSYEIPELIRTIALDPRQDVWSRQRQRGAGEADTCTVAYKTPDYMLASVQDYRPGLPGAGEHVWQATLGQEAIVFTTHPGSYSEADSRLAGWWRGNAVLPRVAQWKDALIALYDAPAGEYPGFTHASFPCYAFDEQIIEQGWAFARKGEAYLALYAANGVDLVKKDIDAFRELRSAGTQSVWLCQMGRSAVDGSFDEFRARVLAAAPTISGLTVDWRTIRGDRLQVAWTGMFSVNGDDQKPDGFKHIDSPYAMAEMPAETMDIGCGQEIMRLHFV